MADECIDSARCDGWVIFLDIDGVLLPVPPFTFGGGELSASCAQYLQRIVEAGGGPEKVSLILSSTWRTTPAMVDRLNRYFEQSTAGALPPVAGGTPNGTVLVTEVEYYPDDPTERRLVRDRVDEIFRWMHTHVREYPEAIGGRWFAIDDMALDVDARMAGHFLKTDTEVGLTEASVETAKQLMASLPEKQTVLERARYALVDPVLKDEEIVILRIQRDRLQVQVNALEGSLAEIRSELVGLTTQHREMARQKKHLEVRMEDMAYRLALAEFSKRNRLVAAALTYAATTSGQERKDIDVKIKALVTLLRARKELEKVAKTEVRRRRKAPKELREGNSEG